jgi:MFS family permease
VLVPLGFLILLAGVKTGSLFLILTGTCITSAASYGFTYLSSLNEVSLRSPDNRARAVAGLFVYAYVGFSVPVIISGALADMFGLLPAMTIFLMILTIITALTQLHSLHLIKDETSLSV